MKDSTCRYGSSCYWSFVSSTSTPADRLSAPPVPASGAPPRPTLQAGARFRPEPLMLDSPGRPRRSGQPAAGRRWDLEAIPDHRLSVIISTVQHTPRRQTMSARFISRAAARAGPALRQQPAAVPRRFASSGVAKDPIFIEQEHAKEHASKTADLWRKISMYGCLPGALVFGVYAYQIEVSHHQHQQHEIAMNNGELPEENKPKYEYQNMRKKPFPWGLQSFFFNESVNYPAEL
ncbi:unnamed protein product [Parajaminaea phylloscopi]